MISVKNASSIISKNSNLKLSLEKVKVENSLGRVTFENIYSLTDNPSFNMSAMDGYAISNSQRNKIYEVIDETFAGQPTNKKLSRGKAIRVFTGSKLPTGTTAIIIQENVKKLKNNYILHRTSNYWTLCNIRC